MGPLVHLKRAFGWNLGRVVPSPGEAARLAETGVTDPVAQRYAAWRRSLLLVAVVPAVLAAALGVLDVLEDGFDEFTLLGTALEALWLVAACALPLGCVLGIARWRTPAAGARLLLVSWLVAFLLPLVSALLPADLKFHVTPAEMHPLAVSAAEHAAEAGGLDLEDVDVAGKLAAVQSLTVNLVLAGSSFLALLPAVFSLIPGAVNGCLRVKSLLPAAQVPGWLLVTVAPAFLLFWTVMLLLLTPAVQGPWLLLGILLWAGSPIVYALRGRVFVQSQIGEAEASRIAAVKRTVGMVALAGIACLVLFVVTTKVAGLHVLGLDHERAMSVRLEELGDADHAIGMDDIRTAYADSESLLYAADLGSIRFVIDLVAKLLLVTAVFAHLVLRAALAAWRNDRALRARPEAGAYDASAAAVGSALGAGTP